MSPPARWLEIRARAADDEPDDGRLAEAMLELGGRAVQEDDGWLLTHVDPAADDARLARAVDDPGPLADLLAGLAGLPSVELHAAWQDHEEWAELWKRGLAPRRVGRRFVVTPSWCVPETTPGDLVIVLDPGMAFGNAEHGTTRGCLRLLERTVRHGERILDVGTGSAVLAIAAALLGAAAVDAVEADPWAVGPAEENVAANGVADVVRPRVAGRRGHPPASGFPRRRGREHRKGCPARAPAEFRARGPSRRVAPPERIARRPAPASGRARPPARLPFDRDGPGRGVAERALPSLSPWRRGPERPASVRHRPGHEPGR